MTKSRIRSGALSLVASQVTSGVLTVGRMLTAVAGFPVRVNAAGNALDSVGPAIAIAPSGLPALTPVAQVILQVDLPVAGTYLVETRVRVLLSTLTATRNISFTYGVSTGFVSMNLQPERLVLTTWSVQSAVSSNNGGTAASVIVGSSRITQWATGPVTVNAPCTLTVSSFIDGDSPTVDAGSFLRATRVS